MTQNPNQEFVHLELGDYLELLQNMIMVGGKRLNGHLMLIHFGTDNRRTDKFYNSYLDKLIKTLKRKGYTFTPILEAIGIKTNSAL